jgi:DNA-binding PadR family transcriptional regulator
MLRAFVEERYAAPRPTFGTCDPATQKTVTGAFAPLTHPLRMSVPHIVLRVLLEGASHGYEIQKKLAELRDFYPLRNVNVYPILRELEGQGLVRARIEPANPRFKKVYEVTEDGIRALERWIATAPDATYVEQRDPVAIKLMLATDTDSDRLAWLETAIRDLTDEIGRLERRGDREPGQRSPLARLTADYWLTAQIRRRTFLLDALRIARSDEPC